MEELDDFEKAQSKFFSSFGYSEDGFSSLVCRRTDVFWRIDEKAKRVIIVHSESKPEVGFLSPYSHSIFKQGKVVYRREGLTLIKGKFGQFHIFDNAKEVCDETT